MTVQIRKLLTSSFLKLFLFAPQKQEEASEELSGVVVAGVVSMSKLREW